jgi:hypothetical protein
MIKMNLGKTCKTGRTYNNHSTGQGTHNNKIVAPVSAPPQISSSNNRSVETHSVVSHPASALDTHDDTSDKDTSSVSDFLTEKTETNDQCQYSFHPNIKSNNLSVQTNGKQSKKKSKRITVGSIPIRQMSRSKMNDRSPSSKGKYTFLISNLSFFLKDIIASFDMNRLPKLPNRSQNIDRLIKQKLLAHNRKTRLSYEEQILFSSLIILNPQSVVQE